MLELGIYRIIYNLSENTDEEVEEVRLIVIFLDPETGVLFLDTMLSDDNFWNRIRLVEILENFDDERIRSH